MSKFWTSVIILGAMLVFLGEASALERSPKHPLKTPTMQALRKRMWFIGVSELEQTKENKTRKSNNISDLKYPEELAVALKKWEELES